MLPCCKKCVRCKSVAWRMSACIVYNRRIILLVSPFLHLWKISENVPGAWGAFWGDVLVICFLPERTSEGSAIYWPELHGYKPFHHTYKATALLVWAWCSFLKSEASVRMLFHVNFRNSASCDISVDSNVDQRSKSGPYSSEYTPLASPKWQKIYDGGLRS